MKTQRRACIYIDYDTENLQPDKVRVEIDKDTLESVNKDFFMHIRGVLSNMIELEKTPNGNELSIASQTIDIRNGQMKLDQYHRYLADNIVWLFLKKRDGKV